MLVLQPLYQWKHLPSLGLVSLKTCFNINDSLTLQICIPHDVQGPFSDATTSDSSRSR